MRIIGGRFRGTRLTAPGHGHGHLRPTSDRVREAVFNLLAHGDYPGPPLPEGRRVLDLFAGTGALGLEALSRGARSADFVESDARALRALRTNLDALDAGESAVVHRADVLRFVEALPALRYDVAFADPPYRQGLARDVAARWTTVPFARLLGVEHEAGAELPPGGATRRYGTTAITLYRHEE